MHYVYHNSAANHCLQKLELTTCILHVALLRFNARDLDVKLLLAQCASEISPNLASSPRFACPSIQTHAPLVTGKCLMAKYLYFESLRVLVHAICRLGKNFSPLDFAPRHPKCDGCIANGINSTS